MLLHATTVASLAAFVLRLAMKLVSSVIERLFARDPRAASEEVLGELMRETAARSAALFRCRLELVLLSGIAIDQACLDRAQRAWRECSAQLRERRPVSDDGWCVSSYPSGRGLLLLYLAGAGLDVSRVSGALESSGALLEMLANVDHGGAARSAHGLPQVAVDSYLGATTPAEVQRRQLMILLQGTEWNIARAARKLGVTRVTIYRRIKRLGIDRLRLRRARKTKNDAPHPPGGGEA